MTDEAQIELPSDGDKPEIKKKERTVKPTFGLVGSTEEGVYPFAVEIPEGWEWGKWAGLKKKDFTEDHFYMFYRAAELESKAAAIRSKAEEIKKLGGAKQRTKAKRLIKLREQFAALSEQLKQQGIDVDALMDA